MLAYKDYILVIITLVTYYLSASFVVKWGKGQEQGQFHKLTLNGLHSKLLLACCVDVL
jgi:hypothetical protein